MKVADVMTREVWTVTRETPLRKVARILTEVGASGLPVVEGDRVVGVVSEADILVKERGQTPQRGGLLGLLLENGADRAAKLWARTAGEAMTAPAITIAPERSVTEAAGRMLDERVNRLPVVDDDGTLVGIVTRADLVRAFVRSDEEIAREITDDLILRTLWIPAERIGVTVDEGEVTIQGHVDSQAEATLVGKFVQGVPGVVAVTSDLTWPDD
jgi:CBS domain-containing protein